MRSRIFVGTIFGAIGGFIGYLLQEMLIRHDPIIETTAGDMMRLGAMIGVCLGVAIGAVEGVVTGDTRRLGVGIVLGGIIGLIGGMFGVYFGGRVFALLLFGRTLADFSHSGSMLDFIQMVIARALGWTFLGAFPGLAAGASTLSPKRALHGLIGGLIGGFIGGVLFDLVGTVISPALQPAAAASASREFDSGGPSRAIGFTAIGLMTGLFIGLVSELLKQAWVRVLAGKNEGKDYVLYDAMTILGRDERAQVPIFGDPNITPQHAAIKLESGRHYLLDGGGSVGSMVNGMPITGQQLLRDGDMIQLGQVRLLFHEKATAKRVSRPNSDPVKPHSTSPSGMTMPSNLCPFCGAQKDGQGNCLCSVPGAQTAALAGYPASSPPGGYGQPMGGPDPYGSVPGFSPNTGDPMGMSYGAPAPDPFASPSSGFGFSSNSGTQIIALDGPYAGQSFSFGPVETNIGRSADNGIAMVNDNTISRRHAQVRVEGGRHVIYDAGSSNGTFVNNVRVTMQPLAPGDTIQMGGSKFRYQ